MDLSILNTAENPIPTHAYAAFLAVILGGIQLSRPKGTSSHKYLGYTWVLLMLWVSISSFWIQTIKIIGPFSPIHFLSIFTIWSVFEAIRSARNGNIKASQKNDEAAVHPSTHCNRALHAASRADNECSVVWSVSDALGAGVVMNFVWIKYQ